MTQHDHRQTRLGTLDVIPLGTSAAIPAHGRHLSATALDLGGEWILFDCGESTQYQIQKAALRPSRLSTICITHLHGDHFFGLPGLLTSMAMNGRIEPLRLVAPERLFSLLFEWPGLERLPYPVEEIALHASLSKSLVVETAGYVIEARPIEHRVFCAGYRWTEKPGPGNLDVEKARAMGVTEWPDFKRLKAGEEVRVEGRTVHPRDVISPPPPARAVAYITDTRPCDEGILLARGARLVIHDSTFGEEHARRAVETGHSTAREAATVAGEAGAGGLLLTHISARYDSADVLVREGCRVFPRTAAATELRPVRLAASEAEDSISPYSARG